MYVGTKVNRIQNGEYQSRMCLWRFRLWRVDSFDGFEELSQSNADHLIPSFDWLKIMFRANQIISGITWVQSGHEIVHAFSKDRDPTTRGLLELPNQWYLRDMCSQMNYMV